MPTTLPRDLMANAGQFAVVGSNLRVSYVASIGAWRRLAVNCIWLGRMRLRTLLESREGPNTSPMSIALPAVANPYALIRRAAVTLL
jgi:hypothetical protein